MKTFTILCLFVFSILPFNSKSQEAEAPAPDYSFSLGGDLVSRYIWRGLVFSPAANFQPWIDYTYKGFSIGSWGSYAIGDQYFETDLYLSYAVGGLKVTLFDYYNESEADMTSSDYFNFTDSTTSHMLEGTIAYTISENLPVTITAATFFYGADYNHAKGKQNYSTYLELAYSKSFAGISTNFFVGAALNEGLYGTKAGVVNLGLKAIKEFKLSDNYSLPVSAAFSVNPTAKDAFLVFGMHF